MTSNTKLSDKEMVLVPREPTREMWAAGGDAVMGYRNRHHDKVVAGIWSAMLAAAPSPASDPAARIDIEAIVTAATQRIMNGFSWVTLQGPENLRARLSMCARQAVHDTLAALTRRGAAASGSKE